LDSCNSFTPEIAKRRCSNPGCKARRYEKTKAAGALDTGDGLDAQAATRTSQLFFYNRLITAAATAAHRHRATSLENEKARRPMGIDLRASGGVGLRN